VKHIATRLSLSQASSGSVSGIFLPFFGAYLAWRGLSAAQIGLLLSSALMLRSLAGPLSGIFADAHNDRRAVMLVLYWVMLGGFGALCVTASPLVIFLTAVPAYVAYGAATPLLESACARLAERYDFDYGRVRIWASTAFVVMNILGGIATQYMGIWLVAPLLTLGAALCVISTLILPAPPPSPTHEDLGPRLKATLGEARELLGAPVFLIFLAAVSVEQATHGFYYGYGGLHWFSLGYSKILVSIIWPLGVLMEIALFSQAPRVLRAFNPSQLVLLAAAFCVVRWTILAFDPPLPLVVLAQLMHGGTFALAHLGAVFFILRAVPPRLAATAQSLYFVCSQGLMMGISTQLAGKFYASLGGKTYLLMAAMGVAAIALAILMARRWHGERVIRGEQDERVETI
jgi:MFS transporter, PPP family, 3-phenylpropionic acid transporter